MLDLKSNIKRRGAKVTARNRLKAAICDGSQMFPIEELIDIVLSELLSLEAQVNWMKKEGV